MPDDREVLKKLNDLLSKQQDAQSEERLDTKFTEIFNELKSQSEN